MTLTNSTFYPYPSSIPLITIIWIGNIGEGEYYYYHLVLMVMVVVLVLIMIIKWVLNKEGTEGGPGNHYLIHGY